MRPLMMLLVIACKKDEVELPDVPAMDVIAVDNRNHQLLRINELGGPEWTLDLPPGTRDLVWWDEDEVLASHGGGAVRVNIETGLVTWELAAYFGVFSALPYVGGGIELAYGDIRSASVLQIDKDGEEAGSANLSGYPELRTIRRTTPDRPGIAGNMLLTTGEPWRFVERDALGQTIWGARLPGRGWQVMKAENDLFYVTTTTARTISVFDRTAGALDPIDLRLLSDVHGLVWLAGFDRATDPELFVVANWRDAPGAGDGVDLLAVTPEGEVPWTWTAPGDDRAISSVLIVQAHLP